jgi:hypothetical protein
MTDIAQTLAQLPVGDKDKYGSLRHLAFIAGAAIYDDVKASQKNETVAVLAKYYNAPNRFDDIWNNLSDAEKNIASIHIWGDGCEHISWAETIAQKYHLSEINNGNYYYYSYSITGLDGFKKRYASNSSKLWFLFPRNDVVLFYEEIKRVVGAIKREYSDVSADTVFSSRESRSNDFVNIVKFCNSNNVSVTGRGALSKSSALKLIEYCGYEERAELGEFAPSQIRTTEQMLVTFPLTVLCSVSGLTSVAEDRLVPAAKSMKLLSLPYAEMIAAIFNSYINCKTFDEISIMAGIKAKRGHHPYEARQNLIPELKLCPVGKPVYTDDFERYIRLANRCFARKSDGYVVETGNGAYGADWERYEHNLINVILTFLGALGVIDVAWGKDQQVGYEGKGVVPVAFRVNPLGAYALGITADYAPQKKVETVTSGGFTVLPDYTIVVPESPNRIRQEMLFEKIFTKVSETAEATIYKLDFDTVVRANDVGKDIAYLRKHLCSADKALPANILRALDDWDKQIGRIRMRQVTILECDDAALLEEVMHFKGMGSLVSGRVGYAFVIDGEKAKNVKKIIEKNGRFCQDVL